MISKSQIFTKDNVLDSVIQVFGFDKKADKFIMAELIKSSQAIEICSTWFTSNKTGETLIINPDKALQNLNLNLNLLVLLYKLPHMKTR